MKLTGHVYTDAYQYLSVILNLGYLLSTATVKPVENFRELTGSKILEQNAYCLSVTLIIMLGCLFFAKTSAEISRMFILVFYISAYILLSFAHWLTRKVITFTFTGNRNKSVSKAIILGAGFIGTKLYSELNANVYLGIKILGFFDDDPAKKHDGHVLGNLEQAKEYIIKHQVETVYCTLPLSAKDKILDFLDFAERNVINFHVVPAILYYTSTSIVLDSIGNIPVLSVRKVPLSHTHNALIKRAINIAISLIF
jgi:FlaA1/EpsC-like NDP-sugar epimerase